MSTLNEGPTAAPASTSAFSVRSQRWSGHLNMLLAREISSFTRYYDHLLQWRPRQDDSGTLFQAVDCLKKSVVWAGDSLPDLSAETAKRTAVLLNGNFNHHLDIQSLLAELKPRLARTSRVVVVLYNFYWSGLYRFANWVGLRRGEQPCTFITLTDLTSLARISGFELVRIRPVAFFPWRWLGLGSLLNKVGPAIPLFRWAGLASVVMLRPLIPQAGKKPTLSVVIPSRNEKGNIENAMRRLPDLGAELEVIFVEGHSNDGTWEEILRVQKKYEGQYRIQSFQQSGKGKADAVRLGFRHARGDLLTILDADLTMPPELLGRFYDAYREGHADFINGSRLVYPMEGDAMLFMNRLGNLFFAKALSSVLETRLGDSLCGTKLVARHDYERILNWRKDFGDFDPFGDFELLFPAAIFGLGIVDIPIRYRARTYGTTNISRFHHGFLLLRMVLIGLFRIRMGRWA